MTFDRRDFFGVIAAPLLPKPEAPPLTADGLKEALGIIAAQQDFIDISGPSMQAAIIDVTTQEDIEIIDWTTPEPWNQLKERAMKRNQEIMARYLHRG